MNAFVDEKIKQISQKILFGNTDIDTKLYENRLRLLYSVVLEEIKANEGACDTDKIIDQIYMFELSQLSIIETTLGQYSNITPFTAFAVFSNAAFGLAVEYLKGKRYVDLSDMLFSVFQGLIDAMEIEIDKMVLSESVLDFNFANGNSKIMSLRLKSQWDLMK